MRNANHAPFLKGFSELHLKTTYFNFNSAEYATAPINTIVIPKCTLES